VYVYGVTRSGRSVALPREGVAGAAVASVEREPLAAIVSELPEEGFRVRRRDLFRHLGVLEAVFADTTIVPCAFGTVLATQDAVTDQLLGERRDELLRLLERLDGRVQVNVRVSHDEDVVLPEIVASDPEIAQLRQRTRTLGPAAYLENIRLGELVAAALAAVRARDADRIVGRLARQAEDVLIEDDEEIVVKGSFLIERHRLDGWDAELDALAASEAPRLRFDVVGPLPPTAFSTLTEE
jgi:Gas vesicle synthesis protein GvpL/GvpF